jgi:hypothetical protein
VFFFLKKINIYEVKMKMCSFKSVLGLRFCFELRICNKRSWN